MDAMTLTLKNHPPASPPTPLDARKEELQTKKRDLGEKLYLSEKVIEVEGFAIVI